MTVCPALIRKARHFVALCFGFRSEDRANFINNMDIVLGNVEINVAADFGWSVDLCS